MGMSIWRHGHWVHVWECGCMGLKGIVATICGLTSSAPTSSKAPALALRMKGLPVNNRRCLMAGRLTVSPARKSHPREPDSAAAMDRPLHPEAVAKAPAHGVPSTYVKIACMRLQRSMAYTQMQRWACTLQRQ